MMARMANMRDGKPPRTPGRAPGPGEQRLRAQTRNRNLFLAGCVVAGMVLGGVLGIFDEGPNPGLLIDPARMVVPPVVGALLAVGFLIGLVALPLYMFRKVDELKVQQNMQAMAAGSFAVIGGYPAWQMLAAGGLAQQPSAFGIFLLGYGITTATFVALKLRS